MTWKSLVAIACLSLSFTAGRANAATIVPGSTFDVTLATYDDTANGYTHMVTTTVPAGGSSVFTYGTATVTISESESTLGTGQQQVTISLISDLDLFPDLFGDTLEGLLGVGIFGNPLQFSGPFNLASAVLTFSNVLGTTHQADFLSSIANKNPFDGVFAADNTVAGFMGVQNQGTTGIQLQLTSALAPAVTPEPSSLVLLATGVLGVAGAIKRKIS